MALVEALRMPGVRGHHFTSADDPNDGGYAMHDADEIAAALLALPSTQRAELAAELDPASRAELDQLQLVIRVIVRLVREDYPARSLVWIGHVWGSATTEELIALAAFEEGAPKWLRD